LVGQETSKVIIEPQTRVVEALRLALAQMGPDDFLRRVEAAPASLEKWVNGQEWIPMRVVSEACEINCRNQEAPPHYKTLSECASGARFRITAGEEVEKQEAVVVERIASIQDEIPEKGAEETTATAAKRKASFQIVRVAAALFFVPIIGAALGFLLGGPLEAAAGAISCYAIVVALSLAFFVLSSKRSRTL
jgi:hypothetical protein